MLRYLADEDLDNLVLRAFRRRESSLDWVRVQDVGLSGCDDELVLEFAAREQRVVLTRDVSTLTAAAYHRIELGEPMPGLIVIPHRISVGQAVDELVFLARESAADEWHRQVLFIPSALKEDVARAALANGRPLVAPAAASAV